MYILRDPFPEYDDSEELALPAESKQILLVALGHEFRSDDGVGVAVMFKMKQYYPDEFEYVHHTGDPASLIELWCNRDVYLVDAANTPAKNPGDIAVVHPLLGETHLLSSATSSHALSLAEAIELAKVLNKLPRKLTIFAIAAEDFSPGDRLSEAVSKAVDKCIVIIREYVGQ